MVKENMQKIKVLYIISSLRSCGPVNVLYNIIKYIDRNIFDISIVTLCKVDRDVRKNEFFLLKINIIELEYSRFSMQLYGRNKLKGCINRIKPDVIHSHCFRSTIYLSKFAKYYKTCVTIHNVPHEDYIYHYGKILGWIMQKIYYNAIKSINNRISCSESIKKEIGKIGVESISIVNGIDVFDVKDVNIIEKNNLKKELNLLENKKIMIVVGELITRKNPLFPIEAFKKMQLEDWQLIFLGDGPLKNQCEKVASGHDVFFLGRVKKIFKYLLAADVFVSASYAEGMPNAVLEAMMMGVPVLLSDIDSHKEIYNYNNEIGNIFENNNFFDFEKKFKCLINKDYLARCVAAKKLVREKFAASYMSYIYQKNYIKFLNINCNNKLDI